MAGRKPSPSRRREIADTWFHETLVRLHRAGEGAPSVGLAPAGRDPGRAWVDATVPLVHYVEGVERVEAGAPHAHEGAREGAAGTPPAPKEDP